jgi:hypothetical protein
MTYEAQWTADRGNHNAGMTPDPSSGTCHLGCLRAHVCRAIRAALKAEDLLTLCFRVEVQSVLASELPPPEPGGGAAAAGAGQFEGYVRGALARALRQVEFPWWVYGELEMKPAKRRGMTLVGPGPARAPGPRGDSTPDGGPRRPRTRQSPG